MIDPKSLRIGNYLQGDPMNIPKWGISSDGIVQITAHGIYLLDEMQREGKELPYKPIPLSEQELIRLGFERNYDGHLELYSNQLFRLRQYTGLKDVSLLGYQNKVLGRSVWYVHDLQNLWHSLTGTELTYKVDSGLTPTEHLKQKEADQMEEELKRTIKDLKQ